MIEPSSSDAGDSVLPPPLPFNDFAKGIYLEEIHRRCLRALRAGRRMHRAITILMQAGAPGGPAIGFEERQRVHSNAFDHAEAVISDTAMVAQLLWPDARPGPGESGEEFKRRKAYARERGSALRQIIGISGDSPLRSKALRNSIEHFDERLDKVTMDPPRLIMRNNIGPIDMIDGIEGAEAMHLHHFNPEDGRYTILGDSVSIPEVIQALQSLSIQVEELARQIDPQP